MEGTAVHCQGRAKIRETGPIHLTERPLAQYRDLARENLVNRRATNGQTSEVGSSRYALATIVVAIPDDGLGTGLLLGSKDLAHPPAANVENLHLHNGLQG